MFCYQFCCHLTSLVSFYYGSDVDYDVSMLVLDAIFSIVQIYPANILVLFVILSWTISTYFRAIGSEVEERYSKWVLSGDEMAIIGARLRNYHNDVCQAARQLNHCFSSILLIAFFNIFIQVIASSFLIDWEFYNPETEIWMTPMCVSSILTLVVYLFAITYAVDLMAEEEANLLVIIRNFTILKNTSNQAFVQLMNDINCPTWKITAAGLFKVDRGIIIQVHFPGNICLLHHFTSLTQLY